MQNVSNDEIIQAVFTATPENKSRAFAILKGEADPSSGLCPPSSEEAPLLLGMGESAKLLGVSRATLWRMIRDGRLSKVEIYHNAYRLRRSDILALVSDRTAGSPPAPSSCSLAPFRGQQNPSAPPQCTSVSSVVKNKNQSCTEHPRSSASICGYKNPSAPSSCSLAPFRGQQNPSAPPQCTSAPAVVKDTLRPHRTPNSQPQTPIKGTPCK